MAIWTDLQSLFHFEGARAVAHVLSPAGGDDISDLCRHVIRDCLTPAPGHLQQ